MKNGKYLITTDHWFYGPDGMQYRAVWGNVQIVEDSALGIKTNRNSTNWYAIVGSEEKQVILAGCQIHYAMKCESKPNTEDVLDYTTHEGVVKRDLRPSQIWIAE